MPYGFHRSIFPSKYIYLTNPIRVNLTPLPSGMVIFVMTCFAAGSNVYRVLILGVRWAGVVFCLYNLLGSFMFYVVFFYTATIRPTQ